MIIISSWIQGGFAAAGLVADSEETPCSIALDPVSYKFIGKRSSPMIYLSWLSELGGSGDTYASDAVITIVKHRRKQITMVGSGGCGTVSAPRISYLERMY